MSRPSRHHHAWSVSAAILLAPAMSLVVSCFGLALPAMLLGCSDGGGEPPGTSSTGVGGSGAGGGSGATGGRPEVPDPDYEIPGTLYYVDAHSGSDSNPGTDAEPFQTVNYALDQVSGGDGIIVRDGDYDDLIFGSDDGLAIAEVFSDWVTIRADEGHHPSFGQVALGTWGQADTTDSMPFSQVGNSDLRLRLDGLVIDNTLSIHGSRYVDVRNCVIRTEGELSELADLGSGVTVFNGQHVLLLDNEVTHSGVGVAAMTTDFVMKGNRIHHNSHDGLKIYGGANCVIEGNVFHDLDDGLFDDDPPTHTNNHVDGIHIHTIIHEGGYMAEKWAGSAINFVIRGNLFYHIESMAVMINQNDSGIGDYETFLWENNIFGPSNGRLFIQGSSFENGFVFRNNTVLFAPHDVWTSMFGREMNADGLDDPSSAYYHVQIWGNPAGHEYYNNIFASATSLTQDEGVVTHNLTIGPDQLDSLPYTAIDGNLQDFLDGGGTLGELVDGSPAIDGGSPAHQAPGADFYGNPRDGTPDIGAVER